MNLQILIAAISPVILILALGFAAGKHRSFNADQARALSRLALQYALPAALFLGMAHFNRHLLLQQGPVAAVMVAGYSGFFLAAYALLRWRKMDKLPAALLGYAVSSTAVPIYGLTVLVPIYGAAVAAGIVGLAALVTNLTQVSVAIFLLQAATAKPGEKASILPALGRAVANPLVWCPILGALVALSGWSLSPYVSTALQPLGVSAAAVAIFASGVALAAYPLKLLSPMVLLGTLVCVVVQPLLFFAMIKLGAVMSVFSSSYAKAAFVSSALPTSTPSVLFAQQYGALEAEMASIMMLTTVGLIVALPAAMAVSGWL